MKPKSILLSFSQLKSWRKSVIPSIFRGSRIKATNESRLSISWRNAPCLPALIPLFAPVQHDYADHLFRLSPSPLSYHLSRPPPRRAPPASPRQRENKDESCHNLCTDALTFNKDILSISSALQLCHPLVSQSIRRSQEGTDQYLSIP